MGLISGLLLLPIYGPARGLLFVLEQIRERVDAELFDEGPVEEELMVLSLRHDLGEIADDDYFAQEAALLERLNAIRAYRESLTDSEALEGAADDD